MKNADQKFELAKDSKGQTVKRKAISDFVKSKPEQMSLFQNLTPTNKAQLMDLFDLMPKFVSRNDYPDETYRLPKLERQFSYREKNYRLVIRPANVDCADKITRDRYPTERDELILSVLLKLATDPTSGCYLDDRAAVIFSYLQVQEELKRIGRTLAYDEIKEALETLKRTSLELTGPDGARIETNLIQDLGHSSAKTGAKAECFVQFNRFVTEAIESGSYRPYDYETVLRYKSILAARLHKRLASNYIQASITSPFNILLSRLLNDSGITARNRFVNNKKMLIEALEEMKAADVIMNYKLEEIPGKGTSRDLKILLTPTNRFVNEMKKSNWMVNEVKVALHS
jgi:hypothetical protein